MLPIKPLLAWLRTVHSPAYRAAKASYLGNFSVLATLVTALFVALTWIWDQAIDPNALPQTFWLRALETLSLLALAPVMRLNPVGWPARIGLFIVPIFVQVTFIEVLSRLAGGLTYGMGGFLYFFIFVPFMAQAQTLAFNASLLAVLGVLPNVLVTLGLSGSLNLSVYNAYVWMCYGPIILMLGLVEYLIYQVHNQHGELKRHADTDALTGLANRRTFMERAHPLMASARALDRPVSVLFADLDAFKSLNDRHGHATGDEVLQVVAQRMAGHVRSTDLVARFGGEEFVILLPDLDAERAGLIADGIRRVIGDEPIGLSDGKRIKTTVSVGYATAIPEAGIELNELIRIADNGVYKAKEAGRNKAVAGT